MEMGQDHKKPRIGVGVIVIHKGTILLGKRLNSHGANFWAPPGGHLEYGETIQQCAMRELLEETNLKAITLREGYWTNNIIDGKHYITFFVLVDMFEGELKLLEPHKCEAWQWFSLDELPSPLFPSLQSLLEHTPIESFKTPRRSLDDLLESLYEFHRKRDWEQFHSPKNLVMDLTSEVGELVEHFRWLTEEQSYKLNETTLQHVRDEIGDVFKIIVYLSHKLGIDPIEATFQKLEKMKIKYPVEACRGKAQKYTAYESKDASNDGSFKNP